MKFDTLAEGSVRRIVMTPKVAKKYKKELGTTCPKAKDQRRSLERLFDRFCNLETPQMNNEQYKKVRSYSTNAGNITLWEFKAWQTRIYGMIEQYEGKPTFIALNLDANKKQDTACPNVLLSAVNEGVDALAVM